MFDSIAPWVLLGLAVFIGLIVIFWPGKKQKKAAKQKGKLTDEMRKGYDAGIAIVKRLELPKQRVELLGVLTIDTATFQICGGCTSAWLGEYVHSERCPKCNGELSKIVAEGAPLQHVVVSEERLTDLLTKLWVRAEQRC